MSKHESVKGVVRIMKMKESKSEMDKGLVSKEPAVRVGGE